MFLVIVLGKALPRLALHYNNVRFCRTLISETSLFFFFLSQQIAAVIPLRALIQRYVPDPSYLTSLHPQFILVRPHTFSPLSAISH